MILMAVYVYKKKKNLTYLYTVPFSIAELTVSMSYYTGIFEINKLLILHYKSIFFEKIVLLV